jgi:carbon-monoxide dehydrogenase medium subunit
VLKMDSELFRPSRYFRPETVREALSILEENPGKARVIAGGTDVLVTKPGDTDILVDISRLPLSYIEGGDELRIGATTSFSKILESSHILKGPLQIISEAAREIGHINLRHIATIGGNLCNAVPSGDSAIPLIALDAVVAISGISGERRVRIEDFFVSVRETVLGRGELLKEIIVPRQPQMTGASFKKIGRTNVDIALVNASVRLTLGERGDCTDARVVLGAVAPTPIRARKAEALLVGIKPSEELFKEAAGAAASESKPISDVRASAEYRREMCGVLVRRALKEAYARAEGA